MDEGQKVLELFLKNLVIPCPVHKQLCFRAQVWSEVQRGGGLCPTEPCSVRCPKEGQSLAPWEAEPSDITWGDVRRVWDSDINQWELSALWLGYPCTCMHPDWEYSWVGKETSRLPGNGRVGSGGRRGWHTLVLTRMFMASVTLWQLSEGVGPCWL